MGIDDATRLAYAEELSDEKQAITVGFLIRALAWFDRQAIECRRVLSDNDNAYRSKPWRQACEALGWTAKRTRTYTPLTNSKAERFIKTMVNEWAYGLNFQISEGCNRWWSR
jgi:transposase InsO family protein